MKNQHSFVKFNYIKLQRDLVSNPPIVVYRYFNSEADRDNFTQGEIWFAGPSQNRFGNTFDMYEDRNESSVWRGRLALSCSMKNIKPDKPSIKIKNINDFIEFLSNTIGNTQGSLLHQVSWLNEEELENILLLIKKAPDEFYGRFSLNKIIDINRYEQFLRNYQNIIAELLSKQSEGLNLPLSSVGGIKMSYNIKKNISGIGSKIVRNSCGKSIDFSAEEEFRFCLSIGNFFSSIPRNDYFYLLKYLKLKCSSIKDFCEPIN